LCSPSVGRPRQGREGIAGGNLCGVRRCGGAAWFLADLGAVGGPGLCFAHRDARSGRFVAVTAVRLRKLPRLTRLVVAQSGIG